MSSPSSSESPRSRAGGRGEPRPARPGRFLRATVAVAGLALGAVLVAGGGFLWLRSRGLPQRSGEARLVGLEAPVTVRWDRWGVPAVTGGGPGDLAAALGWLHANDRFTQMELGRRAAAGRLSELFGERTLELDRRFRTLRLASAAEDLAAATGGETRAQLEAYAAGVNAWLELHGKDLPPTLTLLGAEPEPWRPAHSLAFNLLMAHDLSFWQGRPEETRFLWLQAFGLEGLRDLVGDPALEVAPEILELARTLAAPPPEERGEEELPEEAPPTDVAEVSLAFPGSGGLGSGEGRLGSNNWAVAGGLTAGGLPIFANDPHLPLRLPGTWYQALLRVEGDGEGHSPFEVAGMTLPGLPGVVIGRNGDLAWGFTNTMLDDHDLYFERLSEDGSEVLRLQGGEPTWVAVEERMETILVRGGGEEEIVLRSTDRGVLLPAEPAVAGRPGLPARSLRWTVHGAADVLSPFLALARARRVEELRGRLGEYLGPAQNLVVADRHGGLYFTVLGRVPERRRGDGRMPAPAWDPAWGWDGLRPRETNPTVLQPGGASGTDPGGGDGLLVTANADVRPPGYPLELTADFDTPHREQRIRQLLLGDDGVADEDAGGNGTGWTARGMGAVQTDVRSLYARQVMEALCSETWEGTAAQVMARLASWNGEMTGPTAALFALVERHLGEAIFGDEARAHRLPSLARRARLLRLLEGKMTLPWFDHVATEEREGRGDTLTGALESAWVEARRSWGEDPDRWSWPRVQSLSLAHPLGPLPVLGRWFDRGPFPRPGSATTVNAYGSRWDGYEARVRYGPSMRWVVDLGRPDGGLAVLPAGQSGHPGDVHYDDQIPLYLAGELRPVPWSEEAVEAATVERLRLLPR